MRHYPANRRVSRQREQSLQQESKPRERGWFCKIHNTRYRCEICGDNDIKAKEEKYEFVS